MLLTYLLTYLRQTLLEFYLLNWTLTAYLMLILQTPINTLRHRCILVMILQRLKTAIERIACAHKGTDDIWLRFYVSE